MKKFLSLLLAMAMMLSSIPVTHAQELPKPKHWASEFIQMAIENGILPKSSQNEIATDLEFHPDENITRAQFVTFVNRAFGFKSQQNSPDSEFLDIQSHSAKAQIEIAYAMGYISGFSQTQFAPDSPLTREQALTMIYRIFKKSNPEIARDTSNSVKLEKVFKDADQISDWAKESVSFFVKKEIVKGFPDGSFSPKSSLSAAQSLVILMPSKEVKQVIESEYKEVQEKKAKEEKKVQEEKKREEKKKKSSNSNSNSSSSDDYGSSSSSDSSDSSNLSNSSNSGNPAPNQPHQPNKEEYLFMQKISDEFYLVNINQNEEIARAKGEFFKKYANIPQDEVYFGKIFKDSAKMLVFSKAITGNFPQLSKAEIDQMPVYEGLYLSNNENILLIADEVQSTEPAKITIAVGRISRPILYHVGEDFVGFPNNSIDFGLTIGAQTKMVKSLNFYLENAPKEALQRGAVISQRGRNKQDNPEDLKITNNVFFFGNSQADKKIGINLNIPVRAGELFIAGNQFIGSGEKTIDSPWAGGSAIALNSRALPNTSVVIENNIIRDYPYHGIDITIGEGASAKIINNELSNIGQNAIKMSVFKGEKSLHISGNKVNSYGTRIIKAGSFGSAPKESNKDEIGIDLQYIEDVYGVKVNGKYYNDKAILIKDLQSRDNSVISKEQNDKIQGVLDSTAVEIGQKRQFHNPIEILNSSERIAKDSDFFVIKSTDEDIVLGQDPDNPNKIRSIKNLLITGDGSGRVTLSSNLQISGDLTIDLPNATLQNQANVSGKTHILRSRGNDNSSFSIELNKVQIYKYNATENEIFANISNITTQDNERIAAANSNLNGNIRIFNKNNPLKPSDFQIDDQEDRITFSHTYLNSLEADTKLSIEYSDALNKVNTVRKSVDIEILDKSSAQADFTSDSAQQIIQAFAPAEGMKIQISQIKNILGHEVTKEHSNLSNLDILYIYDNKAPKDEFEIDDVNDIITIKKALLDKLPTPLSGGKHEIRLIFSDKSHNIGDIELRVKIGVINRSEGAGEITTLGVMTFTQGKAPAQGISFQISGMKKADGSALSPSETSLTDYLTIMPFPVNWKDEIDGMGENIGFKKDLYEIDEARDIITFKESYLNHLNPNSPIHTNKGVKQFQLKYNDPRYATFFVSDKAFIHIKSKLKELNNSTNITSDSYNISEDKIASGNTAITKNTKILELLQNLERDNARQTLRVYAQKYNRNGNVDANHIYSYKNDYDHLKSGDFLLVTAEDGKSVKLYQIELQSDIETPLITQFDEAVISNVDKAYISLAKSNVTVRELLDAITTEAEVVKKVISGNQDYMILITPEENEQISSDMKLIVEKEQRREIYAIKPFTKVEYRALIIANSDYPGEGSDLEGPVNDLKLMERTFEAQRFDNTAFKSIKSVANAKKEQFLNSISEAFQDADENDISYLYYSGHGNNIAGMSYICTVDEALSPESAVQQWISVSELKSALDQIKGKKVLILDSCNSGGFIGKPAVDAITGPTPRPISSRSGEFLDDVVNEFTTVRSLEAVNKPNYLIGNDYKVLAASSENEYSYEDKLNKVGKFTKALSEGAGIDGNLLADADKNGEVSLEEMYQYTEDNVVYTSHVQAYPRNDSFRIFANPVVKEPSNNLTISAKNNAYRIIDNGFSLLISSDRIQITTNMSVEDFLSHIEKGDDAQRIYVIPTLVAPSSEHAKQKSDKIAKADRLLVVAENGEFKSFIISVKVLKKPNDKVNISSRYRGKDKLLNINTSANPKEIKGSEHNSITASTKVSEFKAFVLKGHSKQEHYIIPKDVELEKQNAKGDEEVLAEGDRLLVYAESQRKDFYLIVLSDGSNQNEPSTPGDEEADNLSITSAKGAYNFPKLQIINNPLGKKISGTHANPLNTSTKVSAFLEMIVKGNANQELYIIAKGQELNKENKKADDMTLSTGDRLLIYSQSQRTDSYEIVVMLAQGSAIDFGDAFEIQNAIPKYKIIGKSVKINDQMSVKTFLSHIQNKEDMESIFINDEDYLRKGEEDLLKKGDILLVRFKGIPMPYSYSIVVENTQEGNQGIQDNQTNDPSEGSEGGEITIPVPPIQVPPVIITPPENSDDSGVTGDSTGTNDSENSSNSQEGDINIQVPPVITPPKDTVSVPSIEITQP